MHLKGNKKKSYNKKYYKQKKDEMNECKKKAGHKIFFKKANQKLLQDRGKYITKI